MGPLKRAYLTYYKRQQMYPLLILGEFTVGNDAANAPANLELSFPKTVSPAASGSTDSRHLALRVRQVRALPL
jgi:hypothetical protein